MIGKFVSKCCDDNCVHFEPREALKEGTIFPSLTGLYNYNKEW